MLISSCPEQLYWLDVELCAQAMPMRSSCSRYYVIAELIGGLLAGLMSWPLYGTGTIVSLGTCRTRLLNSA